MKKIFFIGKILDSGIIFNQIKSAIGKTPVGVECENNAVIVDGDFTVEDFNSIENIINGYL